MDLQGSAEMIAVNVSDTDRRVSVCFQLLNVLSLVCSWSSRSSRQPLESISKDVLPSSKARNKIRPRD